MHIKRDASKRTRGSPKRTGLNNKLKEGDILNKDYNVAKIASEVERAKQCQKKAISPKKHQNN